ncbi:MAG: hypothetical protein U0441_15350 [Polyangiaceae bacterium]
MSAYDQRGSGELLEGGAALFGVTRQRSCLFVALVLGAASVFSLISFAEGSLVGFAVGAALLLVCAGSALRILRTRAALWRTATLPLSDPAQRPKQRSPQSIEMPTDLSLFALAWAVDQVRRGALVETEYALASVERGRLLPAEERLLDATRALVALGKGDGRAAVDLAKECLPSGSEAMDAALGRAIVASAWADPERLASIDHAWGSQGVTADGREPMPRLRAIVRLRFDTSAIEKLTPDEATALADEARAIGDEGLAADLVSHVRQQPYR